ncbi:hypothetical protein SAMN05660485_02100 [Blastococcus fimeti]|nr:hypothetical protein SAMN05660485_02100 [Blastococcus fimeti]
MSGRGGHRLVLGFSACVIGLVPACGGVADGDDAAAPSLPAEFAATAEVDRAVQVVAGNGAAWILSEVDGGASVLRLDHTGELTEVARLTGQRHEIATYGDGVVVARVRCDGNDCEDTVAEVRVLDRAGETVAEEEIARREGAPYCESGTCDSVDILGVDGDVVWLETFDILPFTDERFVSWDPSTGETTSGRPQDQGSDWLSSPPLYQDPTPYQSPPSLERPPESVAFGQGDQVFVLDAPGVLRRVVGSAGAPREEETLGVPADIFFQEYGPTPTLLFDAGPTVLVGCITQEWPTARCWTGSR